MALWGLNLLSVIVALFGLISHECMAENPDVIIKGTIQQYCVGGVDDNLGNDATMVSWSGVGQKSTSNLNLPSGTEVVGVKIEDNNEINGNVGPGFRLVASNIGLSSEDLEHWRCTRTDPGSNSWCTGGFSASSWEQPTIYHDWSHDGVITHLTLFEGTTSGTVWCRWTKDATANSQAPAVVIKGTVSHLCVNGADTSLGNYATMISLSGTGQKSDGSLNLPYNTDVLAIKVEDSNAISGYNAPAFRLHFPDGNEVVSTTNLNDWICTRAEPSSGWCDDAYSYDASTWGTPYSWHHDDLDTNLAAYGSGAGGTLWCRYGGTVQQYCVNGQDHSFSTSSPYFASNTEVVGVKVFSSDSINGNSAPAFRLVDDGSGVSTVSTDSWRCTRTTPASGWCNKEYDLDSSWGTPSNWQHPTHNKDLITYGTTDSGTLWCRWGGTGTGTTTDSTVTKRPEGCGGKWWGPTPVRGDYLCLAKNKEMTWEEADKYCKKVGATLPRLPDPAGEHKDTQKEIDFIKDIAEEKKLGRLAFAQFYGIPIDYTDTVSGSLSIPQPGDFPLGETLLPILLEALGLDPDIVDQIPESETDNKKEWEDSDGNKLLKEDAIKNLFGYFQPGEISLPEDCLFLYGPDFKVYDGYCNLFPYSMPALCRISYEQYHADDDDDV